jgi:hypothetical protein
MLVSRENWHQPGLPRRMVCRFQQGLGGRGVGRQRRPHSYEGCHGRIVARSDLEALRHRRNTAGRSFEGPASGELTSFSLPMIVKQARCDRAACAAAYSSFRSSDCTYQPNAGQRRLCEKEGPEEAVETLARVSTAAASRLCDPDRCARRYRSFDPLTCTYQPHGGGSRRMCEEGAQLQ